MKEAFQRIVVKIGTNVLTGEQGQLDEGHIGHLVDQIVELKRRGVDVVLVSSGAVTAGRALLPGTEHLNRVLQRQVLSSLGQIRLMQVYQALFRNSDCHVAQVLATKEDFRDRRHYLNMQQCLRGLLRDEIVPILNENDVVAVTELMFTDNDELAGLVAAMVDAQALIILSSVDGLLTGAPGEPGSEVIPLIDPDDGRWQQYVLPARSSFGRGGMHTKVRVARKAAKLGITTFIANGKRPDILNRVLKAEAPATRFAARRHQSSVKRWLAHHPEARTARVYVNEGAAAALRAESRVSSLLPVGVERIEGDFEKGDIVAIWLEDEQIGIGMVQYGAQTAENYRGNKGKKPLVHYDYLLIY